MDLHLSGKRVLVTGASNGIGRAIALLLAEEGCDLVLVSRDPATMRFHYGLRHGTMKVGLYAPHERDAQSSHRQDELYIVISGTGDFVKGTERRGFVPHDVLFVEAGAEHRFENFSADFATWVIFWGAQGGEA